jgi:D-alanyl-D-alanine carboxypeptidase/D-alanyl-D-alanine-endopeptidase (penicillin-binding protein 4)
LASLNDATGLPRLATILSALLLAALVYAPAVCRGETLQTTIEAIAGKTPMNRAQLGVFAIEASSGRVLASRQADHEFIPASAFKLLLAATALDTLGPQFRFTTQLLARGEIAEGRLNGDLILVGGGDPVLSSADLAGAAAAVAGGGIHQVGGSAFADDTLYDGVRWGPDWPWDGTPFYYAAPIQALAIDEGTMTVVIKPGSRDGDPVSAEITPPALGYTIGSRAVMASVPDDDPARCSRRLGTTQILIVGRMPLGAAPQTLYCAVEDSSDYALRRLRFELNAAHVSVGVTPLGSPPPNPPHDFIDQGPMPAPLTQRYPGAHMLWAHQSPPLLELLHTMLTESDNFIAEHILKMLAVRALHQRGSFIGGATVEQRFAVRLGIDKDAIDVNDGSGLSPADRITPHGLVTILRWVARQPYGADFVNALPRAGLDGTLANRLTGTDAVGRVHAKSGYMQHTIVLAGYADTLHHGRVLFAVMVGDATGDAVPYFDLEDQIVSALVDLR